MLPSFFGLNTVTRALMTQQEAIDVVNQNISNASTPGYSRQSAVITATDPYTAPAFDHPTFSGQIGTGAQVTKIDRFQDELLNSQIRVGSQSVGQLQVLDDLYTQIQAIYNDPSNVAINSAATDFFNAVHDMSNDPESMAARQSLQEQGQNLASAISSRYQALTQVQSDMNTKVQSIVSDINSTISQIANLNLQITQVKGIGDNANDLMDQRDVLVDHLSTLIDTRVVQNLDGTDTIQMNGRFLVNKDQAYTLQTLTNAASPAFIKPVEVFWTDDVNRFEITHPGYDPITGVNITTGEKLPSTATPPLSVSQAMVTTGSLAGAMQIRDQVIQGTLLPQLNELADALTNTQVLSTTTGLTASQTVSGQESFTLTVMPNAALGGVNAGQPVKFTVQVAAGSTIQNVIDTINGASTVVNGNTVNVSAFVHAALNASGQLQIDTTSPGTLVKVDGASAAASHDFGFSASLADGFNMVHVQGYGLNTPPQVQGGVTGLTLATSITAGDGFTITAPDGTNLKIVVPATPAPNNESILAPSNASAATTYTLNASPAVAGPVAVTLSGATAFGETATITGKDQAGNALTETLTLSNNGTFVTEHVFASVTDITTSGGMGAQAQLSAAIEPLQQPTVGNLVTAINAAGLSHGVQAALDTQGRFIVYSAPTNYGPDGTALGTPAQVVGNGELGLTSATTFQGGGAITITGPAGTATFNTFAGEGVGQLIQQVNSANLGLTASINSIGQFQLTTLTNGTGQKITIAGAAGNDITTLLGVANGTVTGLDRGFLPSSTIKVATPLLSTQTEVMGSFAGAGPPPPLTTTTNANQFFFQGATQALQNQLMSALAATSNLNTGAGTTFNTASGLLQPKFPAQVRLNLIGAATFPTTFTVNGTDATGTAINDTVTFNADGTATTTKTFQTITSITTPNGVAAAAGFTNARLGVSTNAAYTQYDTAASLAVDANILKDGTLITASSVPSAPGNATNALALLNVQQRGIIGNGETPTTIGDFYSANTSNLGAAASTAHTSLQSEQQLVQHIQTQKQSVVGVSLDEEAANLVALQHAYEAAARAITSQDSMLNTIINGMGLVGLIGGGG